MARIPSNIIIENIAQKFGLYTNRKPDLQANHTFLTNSCQLTASNSCSDLDLSPNKAADINTGIVFNSNQHADQKPNEYPEQKPNLKSNLKSNLLRETHHTTQITDCQPKDITAGDRQDQTNCRPVRYIDYHSIAFFCGLDTVEIARMHLSPDSCTIEYCAARAMSSALGISIEQALGFEPIATGKYSTNSTEISAGYEADFEESVNFW